MTSQKGHQYIEVPFNRAQWHLHEVMRQELAQIVANSGKFDSLAQRRKLGSAALHLIMVASEPSLLLRVPHFPHENLLGEVLAEGAAPKIRFACERARRLAKQGLKSIVWSTFRQNVESMADQLRDLRAVYIHGGIDAGDQDDDSTREGRIKQFRNDPHCYVMVANPAAAAEGISLHRICRHAIYVDRTYNAAHYLQSEDRIHRLGLGPDESPTIEILFCPGSIDESVRDRLEAKVNAMAAALDDPSLTIRAHQYVPFDLDDDPEADSGLIEEDDVGSILEWLRRAE